MSESGTPESESGQGAGDGTEPRAMIHRKILDVAESHPNESVEAIAERVSGASPAFVTRVFEEYDDPGNPDREPAEADGGDADRGVDDAESVTDPDELTPKQRETLRVVADHPSATQKEVAERLGVSRATVSKRVNDVSGFDWSRRHLFVDRVFDDAATAAETEAPTATGELTAGEPLTELSERVATLEEELQQDATDDDMPADDSTAELLAEGSPELVHKTVRAAIDAGYISREEELRIIRWAIGCESRRR